jgi:hypothetical protein
VAGVTLMHLKSRQSVRERKCVMGSSQRYFEYAQECSRWAAEAEERSTQDLFFEMAKASTNIASMEPDVAKQATSQQNQE